MNINSTNYEHYKGISNVLWEFISPKLPFLIDKTDSPLNVLERFELEYPKKKYLSLKLGLQDIIQMIQDLPKEYQEQANQLLSQNSYPSLRVLGAEIRRLPAKVLKRGRLTDEAEYYAIKEIIDDLSSGIPDESRIELGNILAKYEGVRHMSHIFAGDVGINGSRYAPATKLLSSIGYQDAHPSGLRLSNDKDLG